MSQVVKRILSLFNILGFLVIETSDKMMRGSYLLCFSLGRRIPEILNIGKQTLMVRKFILVKSFLLISKSFRKSLALILSKKLDSGEDFIQ